MIKRIKTFLFENRHTKQTVAKNTFWLTMGTIGGRVVKAIIIIYAARVLGAEKYGVFSYALGLAALFSIFADAGTTGVLTREISKKPELLEKYLSTSLVIKLFLVAFSFFLIVVIAPIFSTVRGAVSLLPLAALLTVFDSLRDFSFSITRSWEKMELEAGIGIATGAAITVFGFGALFLHPGPYTLMIGYVLGSGTGLLCAILLLRKYLIESWGKFDKNLAKMILKESMPFALMGLLGALTINTDTIMIGWLRSTSDVGLASAVQRPISLLYLLPGLLASSTFPLFAKLARENNERVRSITERTVSFLMLLAIPIFIGGAILAPQIVGFLFGKEYIPASATFAVLLATVLWAFPAAIITNLIFAYGEQKNLVWIMLIGGIANVIFDYLLIRPFGILGSAFATLISQTLAYGFAWIKMKQINNFYTIRYLGKGFLASLCMGFIAWILALYKINVLVIIAVSALVYAFFLYWFREKHFMEILSPMVNRIKSI